MLKTTGSAARTHCYPATILGEPQTAATTNLACRDVRKGATRRGLRPRRLASALAPETVPAVSGAREGPVAARLHTSVTAPAVITRMEGRDRVRDPSTYGRASKCPTVSVTVESHVLAAPTSGSGSTVVPVPESAASEALAMTVTSFISWSTAIDKAAQQ